MFGVGLVQDQRRPRTRNHTRNRSVLFPVPTPFLPVRTLSSPYDSVFLRSLYLHPRGLDTPEPVQGIEEIRSKTSTPFTPTSVYGKSLDASPRPCVLVNFTTTETASDKVTGHLRPTHLLVTRLTLTRHRPRTPGHPKLSPRTTYTVSLTSYVLYYKHSGTRDEVASVGWVVNGRLNKEHKGVEVLKVPGPPGTSQIIRSGGYRQVLVSLVVPVRLDP